MIIKKIKLNGFSGMTEGSGTRSGLYSRKFYMTSFEIIFDDDEVMSIEAAEHHDIYMKIQDFYGFIDKVKRKAKVDNDIRIVIQKFPEEGTCEILNYDSVRVSKWYEPWGEKRRRDIEIDKFDESKYKDKENIEIISLL